MADIEIPNLCFQPLLRPWGSCRICTVEILGKRGGLIESCADAAAAKAWKSSPTPSRCIDARQFILQMYLIDHALDCPTCDKSGECYLQDNTYLHNVHANPYRRPKLAQPYVHFSDLIDYKWDRCIMCNSLHARLRRDDRRHRDRDRRSAVSKRRIGPALWHGSARHDLHQLRHVHRGLPGWRADRPPFRPPPVGTRHHRDDLRLLRCRLHASISNPTVVSSAASRISGSAASNHGYTCELANGATSKCSIPIGSSTRASREGNRLPYEVDLERSDRHRGRIVRALSGRSVRGTGLTRQHQRRGLRRPAVHARRHGHQQHRSPHDASQAARGERALGMRSGFRSNTNACRRSSPTRLHVWSSGRTSVDKAPVASYWIYHSAALPRGEVGRHQPRRLSARLTAPSLINLARRRRQSRSC